jgi:hypothetical protein
LTFKDAAVAVAAALNVVGKVKYEKTIYKPFLNSYYQKNPDQLVSEAMHSVYFTMPKLAQ